MNWLLVGIVFLIGSAVGSFVNVLVSRSVEGKNWATGRSHCDACGKTLRWYDLFPLFSYIAYRGKSRCCGKKLSLAHPLVEGLFGALFVWWLVVGFVFFRLATTPGIVLQPLFWLGIGVLLLILAVADALYGVILMPILWVAAAWIYGYRLALAMTGVYRWEDLGLTIMAGLLSFLFLWLLRVITKGRGMGDGDPYLAFVTGSLLSGMAAFWGMLLSFTLGSIWGIGLLILGNKKLGQTLPFGPFLVIAAFVTLLFIRF